MKKNYTLLLFNLIIVFVSSFSNLPLCDFKCYKDYSGVITIKEANDLLKEYKLVKKSDRPIELQYSLDLGKSISTLILDKDNGIQLKDPDNSSNGDIIGNSIVTWKELEKIAKKKNQNRCFCLYHDESPWHVSVMSETTGIPASLLPPLDEPSDKNKNKDILEIEARFPTINLGGFTMHRVSGDNMNPDKDTKNKIATLQLEDTFNTDVKILDTCMGLGYTAIAAARIVNRNSGGEVYTCEYDDASIAMCAHNPWSRELYDGSLPITAFHGDMCELINNFDNESFDYIVHDPPARALCRTDLYSLDFYQSLYRILKKKGKAFHYIGNPVSKESGRLFSGVKKRLIEAGFSSCSNADEAFGVLAFKN